MDRTLIELFAGVGGFGLGFERNGWESIWFSQWEPDKKNQWAHDCYVKNFKDKKDLNGEYHTCEDIADVNKTTIPDHTLLTAGFPCQDYSVAHSGDAKGIEGKKGVLWWQIVETIKYKKPPFCLFENVDRLIKSPSKQRGRDFGIILSCMNNLGYSVEWKIIDSSLYGSAQKRKRVFLFCSRNDTYYYNHIPKNSIFDFYNDVDKGQVGYIPDDIQIVSDRFNFDFGNSGIMYKGQFKTCNIIDNRYSNRNLGDILERFPSDKYFLTDEQIEKFKYLKGSKKIQRVSKTGYEYTFSEGAIAFPDNLDRPSRTMLTSEGNVSRTTHVIMDQDYHKLRILTPVECERLQGFDDNWTYGMPERMRYFCMGNALSVDVVEYFANKINNIIKNENN